MTITRFSPHKLGIEKGEMYPQEEMLEKGEFFRKLNIGLPKDGDKFENRIVLIPQVVRQLINEGHSIAIESGVGARSMLSDEKYLKAGAQIKSREEVYRSEIIAKVSPFRKEEIKLLTGNQMIISSLHSNTQNYENLRSLMSKKISAIAMELIRDENNFYPFVHSMSEISGILAITTAGKYLGNKYNGLGILLGGITGIAPARVVILGASTAGEYAAGAALGLGAQVKVFDNSVEKLSKLKCKLGVRIFTSVFQKQILEDNLKTADVVIGAAEFTGNRSQFIVSEKAVKKMKRGSVIIDLNTDNISFFATSKVMNLGNPVFTKHGVIHYCVPNIASEASLTGSIALSNALLPLLLKIGSLRDNLNIIKDDYSVRKGTYIYEGVMTNAHLGRKFNIDYKDIDLLTAIF